MRLQHSPHLPVEAVVLKPVQGRGCCHHVCTAVWQLYAMRITVLVCDIGCRLGMVQLFFIAICGYDLQVCCSARELV